MPAMNGGMPGADLAVSRGLHITKPRVPDRRVDSARAVAFGVNPRSDAARRIRARVSADTPARPFTANHTAPFDAPARAATSEIVGFDAMICRLSSLQTKPVQEGVVNSMHETFHYRGFRVTNIAWGNSLGRLQVR
jgi:hypothetical protein